MSIQGRGGPPFWRHEIVVKKPSQGQRLIVELERDGCHDTAQTMCLLEAFLVLQQSRGDDRARILDEVTE